MTGFMDSLRHHLALSRALLLGMDRLARCFVEDFLIDLLRHSACDSGHYETWQLAQVAACPTIECECPSQTGRPRRFLPSAGHRLMLRYIAILVLPYPHPLGDTS